MERWVSSGNFSPYFIAIISAGLNDTEEVFKWLELTINEHDAFVMVLPIEPILKNTGLTRASNTYCTR